MGLHAATIMAVKRVCTALMIAVNRAENAAGGPDLANAGVKCKTGLALFAALCFAVLAGLHLARPIPTGPDPVLLGFSASDICGYGEAETQCPTCVLVISALPSLYPSLASAFQAEGERIAVRFDEALVSRMVLTPYSARSPPFVV
ncbi:hypothetical protein [Ruegeria arenilitoris]|uniref:hypothetical protein n=1 Tax=Ruegeria arenilitoris TaxID=1173585 RepID=UPI00147A4D3F|nr:hypothetical protein [Ruegeria arenilitoris]